MQQLYLLKITTIGLFVWSGSNTIYNIHDMKYKFWGSVIHGYLSLFCIHGEPRDFGLGREPRKSNIMCKW